MSNEHGLLGSLPISCDRRHILPVAAAEPLPLNFETAVLDTCKNTATNGIFT